MKVLGDQLQQNNMLDERVDGSPDDYAYVHTIARIACYDDLRSAPHIIEISPAPTAEFIENLATSIYDQAHLAGGSIPYTIIREVAENFIHAWFTEIVVSIMDGGNTIRFADQGPGVSQKDKAQLPGFTSATEPMKRYIRGVGSGLPIVKEYLDISHGTITIEDNIATGAVITISMAPAKSAGPTASSQNQTARLLVAQLTQRERDFLSLFLDEGALGVTDIARLTETPVSTTHVTLKKLEENGFVEKAAGQKRILTDLGYRAASSL